MVKQQQYSYFIKSLTAYINSVPENSNTNVRKLITDKFYYLFVYLATTLYVLVICATIY